MKIAIQRLNQLKKLANTSYTVLHNSLVWVENGTLYIHNNDAETYLTLKIKDFKSDGDVEPKLYETENLVELLKASSDIQVEKESIRVGAITLMAESGIDIDDYGRVPDFNSERILNVTREDLSEALIFSAVQDVRYYLNGVLLAPDNICSTDGHKLYVHDKKTGVNENTIVGREFIEYLNRVKPTKEDYKFKIMASKEAKNFSYSDEEIALHGRIIDSKFPHFEVVINSVEHGEETTMDKPELLRRIKELEPVLKMSKVRLISFHDNKLKAHTHKMDGCVPLNHSKVPHDISFNGFYLEEVLKIMPDKFQYKNTSSVDTAKFYDQNKAVYLMPMKDS